MHGIDRHHGPRLLLAIRLSENRRYPVSGTADWDESPAG
jgi:hypothetical protein